MASCRHLFRGGKSSGQWFVSYQGKPHRDDAFPREGWMRVNRTLSVEFHGVTVWAESESCHDRENHCPHWDSSCEYMKFNSHTRENGLDAISGDHTQECLVCSMILHASGLWYMSGPTECWTVHTKIARTHIEGTMARKLWTCFLQGLLGRPMLNTQRVLLGRVNHLFAVRNYLIIWPKGLRDHEWSLQWQVVWNKGLQDHLRNSLSLCLPLFGSLISSNKTLEKRQGPLKKPLNKG